MSPADTPSFPDLPEGERRSMEGLRKKIEDLLYLTPESVLRSELGPLGFEADAAYPIARIRLLLNLLKAGPIQELWSEKHKELDHCIDGLMQAFHQMRSFDPKQGGQPYETRNRPLKLLLERYTELCSTLVPVIPFLTIRAAGVQEMEAQARDTIAGMILKASTDLDEVHKFHKQAESTLEKIRTAAGEVGVAKYAGFFKIEAKGHQTQAWAWALAAVVLAGGALVYTIYGFEPHVRSLMTEATRPNAPVPSSLLVPLAISRLVLISLLYVGVFWSIRNFSAARHNVVVNRHQQNALSSFEAFVKAAEGDPQTKNAVLLQATQSIFAPQASGYLKTDNDMPSGNHILEIVRSVTDGKGH
jgi:hypothetical protein